MVSKIFQLFCADFSNVFSFFEGSYDTTPPFLKCPAEQRVFVGPGESTRVYYTIDYYDNSGGNVDVYGYPPSGSLFYIGTRTVWVILQDDVGNTNYCRFNVIVSGTTILTQRKYCDLPIIHYNCFQVPKWTFYTCRWLCVSLVMKATLVVRSRPSLAL